MRDTYYSLLILILFACAPKPPDIFVFKNFTQRLSTNPVTGHLMLTPSPTCMARIKEPECGCGVSIVTGSEITIGEAPGTWFKGKPWSKIKAQSIYVPAVESYAPLETYIINSCKKAGCEDDVTRFKVKLDSLNGIGGAIENN